MVSPEPFRAPAAPVPPAPITADAPGAIPRPLLTQSWLDLTFLHWAADPADVAGLLPPGTVPDTLDGVTYVGLVAFRMHKVGWLRLPGVPYLGSFPETNVRLYSVDAHGRRGVVFRSLDASRLLPVVVGRIGFRMPYLWSRMTIDTTAYGVRGAVGDGPRPDTGPGVPDTPPGGVRVTYTSRRRWPGPRGAYSRITMRVGERVDEPTGLEHFLTARWGMHGAFFGRPMFLPNAHPRWPLHRAELVECEEDLVAAAGLPAPVGPPVSVLYSPGVPARFGRPARPAGIPTP
ncbi:YqjF family protein [Streptomyces ossamyceticus]|uniref:YqjF family protein n=1 Tax=Streptomyces ossamyceticus TaxID=249581 RepID=UPI00344403CF